MSHYFPEIYPDELLGSAIARAYSHSGFSCRREFKRAYFSNDKEGLNYIYYNNYSNEIKNHLKGLGRKKLITNHTLCLERSLLVDKYKKTSYFRNNKKVSKKELCNMFYSFNKEAMKFLLTSKHETKKLAYCPLCVEEDREKYGEAYFHKQHQLADCCLKHKCKLIDSDVESFYKKGDSTILDLESVVKRNEVKLIDENDIKYKFVSFKLCLYESLPKKNISDIHLYVRTSIPKQYWLINKKQQINYLKLESDLAHFFKSIDDYDMSVNSLKSFLQGRSHCTKILFFLIFFLYSTS